MNHKLFQIVHNPRFLL